MFRVIFIVVVICLSWIGPFDPAHADRVGRGVSGSVSPLAPATPENAIGVWIGYSVGALYRIELLPDAFGTVVMSMGKNGELTHLYRVQSWTISRDYTLSIIAKGIDEFRDETLLIDGMLFGNPSKLTMSNRYGHFDLQVMNEELLLEQSRSARERAQRDRAR